MGIQVKKGFFDGLTGALEDAKSHNLWPTTYVADEAIAADLHWHSEDVHVYVMEGETYFIDGDSGKKHPVTAGDKVMVPARTLHAEGAFEGGIVYLIGIPEALASDRFLMQRLPEDLASN